MGWPRDVKDLGRRGLPALFALGAASGGLSPARAGDAIDLTAPIPPDSALVTGTLPNGFAYAVRPNGWPENRIDLRLVVRVGSILEEDDQRGLAHFVEHMAFNGSAHFGADALVAYFESIGARFGADLNASTGYDETMYRLDVPADDDSLFDRGLLVLADFAARVAFADSEIERERGVVLDEWRRRQGASERMRRVIDPVLYHGSRYADRDPIGLPDVIQHAPADRIRDFYRRWYRPENMAVVVVGAVDPTHALARIQAHFGELPGPAGGAAAIPAFPVPLHDATLYAVTTDSEARLSTLSLVHKRPRPAFRNLGDIRQSFVRSLVVQMLNDRFRELARIAAAPFLSASAGSADLGRTVRTFTLTANVPDGGLEDGLRALVLELRRAREHGFGAAELERAKQSLRASYERAHLERTRTESAALATRFVAQWLDGFPAMDPTTSFRLLEALLPGIGLDDVHGALAELASEEGRVVIAQAPAKEGLAVPTETGLQAAFAAAWAEPVTTWHDQVAGRELLEKRPRPGKVASRRAVPSVGATVLVLSNGVEVWLKPTDFKKDQVLFSAYAFGGASLAAPENYQQALQAPAVVRECGVGGFTPVEITKLLAGKLVGVGPSMGNFTHGLSGSSAPEDVETALQLVYHHFTQVTERLEAAEVVRKQLRTSLANRAQDPETAFFDSLRALNTGRHYMSRPITLAEVEGLRLVPVLRFYRERFANAADFTFFFVGAFDPAALEPLVLRYLGSLPSKGRRRSSWLDRQLRFPAMNREIDVRKGREPKGRTALTYFADAGSDEAEIGRARAAADLLQIKLREILREDLGSTYGVTASYASTQPVPGYGTMSVGFTGAPESQPRMVEATRAEIARLQAAGPAEAEVQKIQELARRELELAEKQNGWWLGALQSAHQMGWDPAGIVAGRDRIAALTAADLQAAFRKYFPADRSTRVSLLPE